ncbi:MAG TPA: tetratricopeptide repeat protein [Pyrinomonadaceae bacterium]|jgi:TolB-like protein/Tfp pilus assembly protein PilF
MDKLLNFLSQDCDEDEGEYMSEAEAEEELRREGVQPLALRQQIKELLFPPSQVPVLAVRPFSTLNTEQAGEVLLDMADQISLRLSRYRQVIVRPLSSVLCLSTDAHDPVKLGRKLGADFVLTGDILGEGEKISVVARFNRVRDGAELWEGKYDGSVNQIFKIEDLITERVIRRLNLRLAKDDLERLTKSHSENPDAYHKYRLARCHLNKYTRTSLEKAAELFKEAISSDPQFAPAHAGLADTYIAMGMYNIVPPMENFERGFAHARDAVRLDPTLVEAHTSEAYAHMCYGWNWECAESAFRKAIELNPNYAPAHQGYAHLLGALGRFQEAQAEIDRGLELDPTSVFANTVRGFILYYAGRYEESSQQFYRTRNLNSHFDAAYYGLALACEQLALAHLEAGDAASARDKFDEAEWAARCARKFSRNNSQKRALQAHIYALRKEQDKALHELAQLEALCEKEYVSPFHMATIYAAQGRIDKAIICLRKAYKLRDQWLVLLNVEPRFAPLRQDKRFKKLLRRLGFPSAARLPKRVALAARVLLPSVFISSAALLAMSAAGGVSRNSLLLSFATALCVAASTFVSAKLQKALRTNNIILPTIKLAVIRWWRQKTQRC